MALNDHVPSKESDSLLESPSRPSYHSLSMTPVLSMPIDKDVEKNLCSYRESWVNEFNYMLGLTLFSIPYALKDGGLSGLFVMAGVSLAATFSAFLFSRSLIICANAHHDDIDSYDALAGVAFGKTGIMVVRTTVYLELFVWLAAYTMAQADNLEMLFPDVFNKTNWVIVIIAIQLPSCFIRNFKILARISTSGIFATFLTTAFVVVSYFVFLANGSSAVMKPKINFSTDMSGFIASFGIIMAGFSGHAVFPVIENKMKDKSRFFELAATVLFAATFTYSLLGICGYLMFGDATRSQITLNYPGVVGYITRGLLVYNCFSKYSLTVAPIAAGPEKIIISNFRYLEKGEHPNVVIGIRLIIRTTIVVAAGIVAVITPDFAYICGLLGSLLVTTLSLTFPAMIYLKLDTKQGIRTKLFVGIFMLFGIFLTIVSTLHVITKP